MGLIQADMKCRSMQRIVRFNVILPVDEETAPLEAYPTLYLLHGIYGNASSWLANSNIRRYAEAHRLAVVMPEGENGFYLDHPDYMNRYSAYVGDELVQLTRKLFPLSRRREETYIGGFSMGGYGALVNGLRYPENFSRIIALSAGLLLEDYAAGSDRTGGPVHENAYFQAMFGDRTKVLESDMNPAWLARRLLQEGRRVPAIYMSCGTEDFLIEANRRTAEELRRLGLDFTFRTAPGAHTWDFWDAEIRRCLETWLPRPTDAEEAGLAH